MKINPGVIIAVFLGVIVSASFVLGTKAQTPVAVCNGAPCATTPVVSASAESSHVIKAGPGFLFSVYASNPSGTGFLMVFNSTTVPGDGAVTPIECIPVSIGNVGYINYMPGPPGLFLTGISVAFSSTGCFTKTTSPTVFFHAVIGQP